MIWIGEDPGIRLELTAASLEEARAKVESEYGLGHTISLWNEEDAAEPR
jgi:hypothetical protein